MECAPDVAVLRREREEDVAQRRPPWAVDLVLRLTVRSPAGAKTTASSVVVMHFSVTEVKRTRDNSQTPF